MTHRAFTLAALLLGGSLPEAVAADPPHIVGGWSEIPRAALAAEAGPAARFAVSHLPRPHGKLKAIVGAEQQVVAGINYRIELVLTGGKHWRVVVWRKLDGSFVLTSAKRAN